MARKNNKFIRSRRNQFLKDFLIIVMPIILCVGGYFVYDHYIKKPGIPSVNKLIEEKQTSGYKDKDENKIDVSNYVNQLPDFRAQYGNYEIMGRLEIPNLNINAMIVRATDNEYYLNYNLYHQWDGLGVPFFDYRNQNLNTDRQVNIYGHNTQREEFYSQLPFTNLEAYVDKNIFDNYKDVYLSIDERQINYEVVAIKILTDGSNEHMKLVFSNDMDFLQHINRLLSGALYVGDNASFTASDRLLVLQVCHYDPMGSYLLVICKEKK